MSYTLEQFSNTFKNECVLCKRVLKFSKQYTLCDDYTFEYMCPERHFWANFTVSDDAKLSNFTDANFHIKISQYDRGISIIFIQPNEVEFISHENNTYGDFDVKFPIDDPEFWIKNPKLIIKKAQKVRVLK